MSSIFQEAHGSPWLIRVMISLIVCGVLIGILQILPKQNRKHLILGITFVAGLFFAMEFFLNVHPQPTVANPSATGNFLSPFMEGVTNWLVVVTAFTVGLGVINLSMVHGKRITKGGNNAFNSGVFFVAMFVMAIVHILDNGHPNAINKGLFNVLFNGALTTLDATMFSIIAFYIVSASYRAFRVRSTEATILLITAVVVMLGQIAVGQWMTKGVPGTLFHFEVVRDWILTIPNTAAVRAIGFGLGIGGLAVALRIWLGLERGSYFDSQG